MKAFIYSGELSIGHADLQIGDESMGSVYGDLVPNEHYYASIQPAVREFWGSPEPDYTKWEALQLNARLENGYWLYAIGGYTFDDTGDFPEEQIRVDIAGLFRHVIEDYFISDPARPFIGDPSRAFVEEPWVVIGIGQKIALEAQLQKEIETTHSVMDRITSNKMHVLADHDRSALCRNRERDDVVFAIHKDGGSDKHFALVHLTHSLAPEQDPEWPSVRLFGDFDECRAYMQDGWV